MFEKFKKLLKKIRKSEYKNSDENNKHLENIQNSPKLTIQKRNVAIL